MEITPLSIAGAFVITPRQFRDDRGVFLEAFRGDLLERHLGRRPDIIQTNVSVSRRGTVRGIHLSDVPPGQAKYVMALSGSLVDYVIDLRIGSHIWSLGQRPARYQQPPGGLHRRGIRARLLRTR